MVEVHNHDDKLAESKLTKLVNVVARNARAKAKAAQQGGPSPQPLDVTGDGVTPLTSAAGEVTAGGSAQPEDPEARRPRPSPF